MIGYIKFYRTLLEWEWYDDINVCRLFFHLLLKVNFKDMKWKGVDVPAGHLITGRLKLAKETGLSEMQIRSALNKLKSTNEITIKATKEYSLIRVNNWSRYQEDNQQTNQQATNKQPTSNQQVTTRERKKEGKKERKKESNIEVEKIFNQYEESFKTTLKAKTETRKKKIQARLQTFSLEEILKAIKNYSVSPWHTGQNDRNWKADFDWIINSDERIEKGLQLEVKVEPVNIYKEFHDRINQEDREKFSNITN